MINSASSASAPSSATGLKRPLLGIAAGIVFVGLVLAVLVYFDLHEQLVELLEWIDAQGAMAAVYFILLMTAVVVLLLPGIFLTTGAGFVFGLVEGTVLVVAGTVIGASLAFLIARHLFGERASRFILSRSNLQVVSDEMARHDFKVVMLTRLIPFFPGKISNYFFGLTKFTFKGFVLGSLIGFIPFSLHNVYLGSITADLASLSRGEVARSPLQWALYGLGFVATIVALLYFNNLARRALAAYSQESGSVQGGKSEPEAVTSAKPTKDNS
ncbi:MAG: TVP38/TMEM64 family protein [Salinivirgaceae bacterium]|nr:TVP38/TMEM64 family protein [Salinivirgaceae bacterium]